jgi:hypothetical protein
MQIYINLSVYVSSCRPLRHHFSVLFIVLILLFRIFGLVSQCQLSILPSILLFVFHQRRLFYDDFYIWYILSAEVHISNCTAH